MRDFIQHTLTVLVTGLVLWLAVRAARRPPEKDDLGATVLVYPRFLRGFFLFGIVLFLVLSFGTILVVVLDDGTGMALLLSLLLYVPLTWLCIGERRLRVALDDEGIVAQTAFRGEVRMTWKTVKRMTYSRWNRWYVLEDEYGQKVRVPQLLAGSRALLDFLEQHVDPAIWEPAAKEGETARGSLF